jgi:hypothetical protein
MIIFELACANEHRFEGWFASAEDFDRQSREGLLICPTCADRAIEKLPSARIGGFAAPQPPATVSAAAQPAAPTVEQMARMLGELLARTEDVGTGFAEEARRIHYEEVRNRPIRGVATRDETEALLDEGIGVLPLPIPPREDWN